MMPTRGSLSNFRYCNSNIMSGGVTLLCIESESHLHGSPKAWDQACAGLVETVPGSHGDAPCACLIKTVRSPGSTTGALSSRAVRASPRAASGGASR